MTLSEGSSTFSESSPDETPSNIRLRIALLVSLSPRKVGSMEEWLVAVAREATRRNHRLDVFGLAPIHSLVGQRLDVAGAGWDTLDSLTRNPIAGVWRLRRYDAIHLGFLGAASPAALLAYAAYPARIVFVDHFSRRGRPNSLPSRVKRWLVRRIVTARVAIVVGVSEFVRRHAAETFGIADDRSLKIFNGVSLERFESKGRHRPRDRLPVILAVANLIPEKGIHVLLRAVASLGAMRLLVAGDGPEAGRLRRLAGELGIDGRTEFLGIRDDVERLLAECDVFVHPATWTEAFGLTIAEAMASGRPVVASNTGAIPELVQHGHTGLLVEPNDVEALAVAIGRLISDPELGAELGRNARRFAERHFDLARCASEHVDVLERVARS